MTYKEENSEKIRIKHRISIICSCGISVHKVLLFQNKYMFKMYVEMKDDEFKKLMQDFRMACKCSNMNK